LKRIIVDYKKLTPEILNLLVEKFPDGYGIRDVVKFTNHKGQYVEAVEVSTEDTMYLVKISNELVDSMDDHEKEAETNSKIEEGVDVVSEEVDLENLEED